MFRFVLLLICEEGDPLTSVVETDYFFSSILVLLFLCYLCCLCISRYAESCRSLMYAFVKRGEVSMVPHAPMTASTAASIMHGLFNELAAEVSP